MTAANVPMKFFFEVNKNMVSSDDSAKKGMQLSLIEDSCINRELKKKKQTIEISI